MYHVAGAGDTLHISTQERKRWSSSQAKTHLYPTTGIQIINIYIRFIVQVNSLFKLLNLYPTTHLIKIHQNSSSLNHQPSAGRGKNQGGDRTFGKNPIKKLTLILAPNRFESFILSPILVTSLIHRWMGFTVLNVSWATCSAQSLVALLPVVTRIRWDVSHFQFHTIVNQSPIIGGPTASGDKDKVRNYSA